MHSDHLTACETLAHFVFGGGLGEVVALKADDIRPWPGDPPPEDGLWWAAVEPAENGHWLHVLTDDRRHGCRFVSLSEQLDDREGVRAAAYRSLIDALRQSLGSDEGVDSL